MLSWLRVFAFAHDSIEWVGSKSSPTSGSNRVWTKGCVAKPEVLDRFQPCFGNGYKGAEIGWWGGASEDGNKITLGDAGLGKTPL